MKALLAGILVCLLGGVACAQDVNNRTRSYTPYPVYTVREVSKSADISPYFQMDTTDGSFSFSAADQAIAKFSADFSTVLLTNSNPFTGATGFPIHVGAGKLNGGFLYAAINLYGGDCASVGNSSQVIKYNESDISFVATYPVYQFQAVAGVAVDTDSAALATIDFCNVGEIIRLNLSNGSFKDTILLAAGNFARFQGIAYRNGQYWVSAHEVVNPLNACIVIYNKSGTISSEILLPGFNDPSLFETEDVDIVSSTVFSISYRDKTTGNHYIGYFTIPAGV